MKKALYVLMITASAILFSGCNAEKNYSRADALSVSLSNVQTCTTDTERTFITDGFTGTTDLDHFNELAEMAESMSVRKMKDADYYNLFFKDGDFIYITADHQGGMSQDNYLCLRSEDGGKTYYVSYESLVLGSDIEAFGHYVITVSGSHFLDQPSIEISLDYGSTFFGIDYTDFWTENALFQFKEAGISLQYEEDDAENGTIKAVIDVHDENFHDVPIGEMTLNLNTCEICDTDIYMEYLNTYCNDHRDTGYWLKDALEQNLDKSTLTSVYNQMEMCSGPEDTAAHIRLVINEIYARLGYDFTGTDYEDAFSSCDWYHPVAGKRIAEEELSAVEKANIDLLVELENEYKAKITDE